jgi:signal transduction histidine kinase
LLRVSGKTLVVRAEAPLTFPMFKKDFDEILSNLVHNAIKYSSEPSKIKITFTHGTRSSRLDVTSYGIMIPPQDFERIFDRGYRTDLAVAITFNALGIGLYQSRRLAENAAAKLFVSASENLTGIADTSPMRIHGKDYPVFRNTFRLLAPR